MEPIDLPQFKDVPWRWISYATSALVIAVTAFAFFHEVELKQDVRAEIVSPSEIKIQGLEGLVAEIYVREAARVALGAPLFRLERDLSLASDGRQRPVFDEHMRDGQLASTEAQYRQRKSELTAQRENSQLTEASRRAEMSALDEQLAQNRQLVDESARKLSRLESVSEYVTAERIEQAKVDTHQAKVVVAQSAARRQQLVAEVGTARSAQAESDAQLKELDARRARSAGYPGALRTEPEKHDDFRAACRRGVVFRAGGRSHDRGV
jgi:membrane fusion protein